MSADDRLPPLISPRSPSYQRSRNADDPPGDPGLIAALNRLSEAEDNGRRALLAGARRATDEDVQKQLRGAAATLEQRRQALGELIEQLGGSPPRADEVREVLSHGEPEVARAIDEAAVQEVLGQMRAELAAMHAEALASPKLEAAQRAALAELAPG